MDTDEFRDYILGFIFYKYLSDKMYLYANRVLEEGGLEYDSIDESTQEGQELPYYFWVRKYLVNLRPHNRQK